MIELTPFLWIGSRLVSKEIACSLQYRTEVTAFDRLLGRKNAIGLAKEAIKRRVDIIRWGRPISVDVRHGVRFK